MRTIAILFTLFYFLNALAVAPYGFKGQEQSQTLYSNVLQAPNNLVTNLGGINALMETGNNNLLVNPSFEHLTFSTGWTNSAGTFTEETVVEIHGKKAAKLVLSSQTMSLTQSSTLYQAQFADGVQGLASVRVKSNVALKVCSIQAGTVSTTNCVDVQANNKWGLYKVPFILGATSNGISIASTGAVSGTVYIDDAFVGAVDLKADIDASKVAGESYFAGTSACSWSRTSAAVGAFTATVACPGPTIVYSSMGQWQTTDSDLPRQTINNLPAGTYKATFFVTSSMSANAASSLAINDGTSTCYAVGAEDSSATASGQTISCTFTYTNSGNRSFELYGASASSTLSINNAVTSPPKGTKFQLEYFGSSSVYSSTNADTDWASCTPSSSQGFTSPTFSVQCKRQGSDLLVKGTMSTSGATAVEARVGLPLWNGSQLVSAGSSVIPSLQVANGFYVRGVSSNDHGGSILIEPSVSYITFSSATVFNTGLVSGLSKSNASNVVSSASADSISFNARIPIEGWQNSNIIIGQFNGLESCTDTYQCTDTFSAKVSAAGIVSEENLEWITGNATVSGAASNVYSLTLKTGMLTVTPNCVFVHSQNNSLVHTVLVSSTASNVTVASSRTDTGAGLAGSFQIICQKAGADYIGKTARAVANDQSLRVPGTTNYVTYMASLQCSSASSILHQDGAWVSSIGNIATGTCAVTLNSNKFSNANYRCSSTFTSSQNNTYPTGGQIATTIIRSKTATGLNLQTYYNSGGTTVANTEFTVDLICTGQAP